MGIQVQGSPRRLKRMQRRKYVVVAFKVSHVPQGHRTDGSPWRPVLGMCANGHFEALGAWPSAGGVLKQIADLAERGVDRIQVMYMPGTIDHAAPAMGTAPADCELVSPSPQVGDFVPTLSIATRFGGSKRRALLSGVAVAECLQGDLVRAVRRRAPFESAELTHEVVSRWLQGVDRKLSRLSWPSHSMSTQVRASSGAPRASEH